MRRKNKKVKIPLKKNERLIRFFVIVAIVFVVIAMVGLGASSSK